MLIVNHELKLRIRKLKIELNLRWISRIDWFLLLMPSEGSGSWVHETLRSHAHSSVESANVSVSGMITLLSCHHVVIECFSLKSS